MAIAAVEATDITGNIPEPGTGLKKAQRDVDYQITLAEMVIPKGSATGSATIQLDPRKRDRDNAVQFVDGVVLSLGANPLSIDDDTPADGPDGIQGTDDDQSPDVQLAISPVHITITDTPVAIADKLDPATAEVREEDGTQTITLTVNLKEGLPDPEEVVFSIQDFKVDEANAEVPAV